MLDSTRRASFDWDEANIVRFMSYVDKLPCGCWFWTGARSRGKGNKKWYGTFTVKGKSIRAHRFSAVAIGGQRELEPGEHRDHKCVFSLCVNPYECLEIVTKEENQKRKVTVRQNNKKIDTKEYPECADPVKLWLY